MIYNTVFAKSFSRYEQKRLGYGAVVAFLLILLSLCTVFKPYLAPIHDLNLRLSIGVDTELRMVNDTRSSRQIAKVKDIVSEILVEDIISSSPHKKNEAEGFVPKSPVNDTRSSPQIAKVEGNVSKIHINDTISPPPKAEVEEKEATKVEQQCISDERTEYCQTQGDIRVHGKSSSVYIVSQKTNTLSENMSQIIRPYARKDDVDAMNSVRKWSVKVKDSQQVPKCTQNHSIPAVIFSTAGYTGNHFHEFTDILIPLFLTCRQFNGQVQLIITDKRSWWISKHLAFLNKLSNYEIMDTDKDDDIHCFPSVFVGLKRSHKELSIDSQMYRCSIKNFRDFLRSSYSLKRVNTIKTRSKRPRLLILSRKRSRSFTNIPQIARMAKGLGFKVIVKEAEGDMWSFAHVVNSCDVVMGVHGAGLTNILFLPENAIFIQVVPYGGFNLEWLAKTDFGKPSVDMNIKYLEYKIRLEESTLIQQYPLDHVVIKDPESVGKQGWVDFKSVYLDKQNVKLDVTRFRPTLQKALQLLPH